MVNTLLRLSDVMARTGLSRTVVYALIKRRAFPSPLKVAGTNCARWPDSAIQQWIESQMEGHARPVA